MASLEDYDEFGNYIGADLDSEEDDDDVQQHDFSRAPQQPLEGFEDEPMPGATNEGALMEIDGKLDYGFVKGTPMILIITQNLFITRSFCTKTSSTIPVLRICMDQTSKHSSRRRTRSR